MASRLRPLAPALVAVLTAVAWPEPSAARRLFVPRQVPTIQRAVDQAAAGDTVWVAAGTYRGTISIRTSLVLFADQGPDSTVLDGGDSARVLHIEGVRGASVIGFTIRRGRANAGGGIHCARDTSVMIASCTLEKNWESAISAWQCGDLNLREIRFLENEGSAVSLHESTALIRECAFEGNRGYAGGAIALHHSKITFPLRGCSFQNNRAEGATGGAVMADSSEIVIGECLFDGNSAHVAGGAISGLRGSRVLVSRSRFMKNRARAGGAAHADRAALNVAYSIFDLNEAITVGAALSFVGQSELGVNSLLQNNTFYKNVASGEAADIWAERVSPELRRNIFVVQGGRPFRGVNSSPLYECNLVHDPSGASLASLPSVDTLVGDPLFCDVEKGDFYLRDLSPAALAPCGPIGALPKRCTSFRPVPSR